MNFIKIFLLVVFGVYPISASDKDVNVRRIGYYSVLREKTNFFDGVVNGIKRRLGDPNTNSGFLDQFEIMRKLKIERDGKSFWVLVNLDGKITFWKDTPTIDGEVSRYYRHFNGKGANLSMEIIGTCSQQDAHLIAREQMIALLNMLSDQKEFAEMPNRIRLRQSKTNPTGCC